jgi:signal transduction histidine kinase
VYEGLTAIEAQTHQLTNIVNTFLEVTQLNRGQLTINSDAVNLAELTRQVVSSHRATSAIHSIHSNIVDSAYPYLVKGDSARLSQILVNLLQNAIKYSPRGGPITISLCQYQNSEDKRSRTIEVCVEDKGIGIPPDALQHLFERFYRASNIEGHNTKGVGLGLFIVAELLRMHGGTIRAESRGVEGEGSRFIFTLPALESDIVASNRTLDVRPTNTTM